MPDNDHRLGRFRLRGGRRARCRHRGRRPRVRALGGPVSGRVSAPGQHRRSCGEREELSRHTSTLRPGATPGSGQRLAQVAGWTHAHTHDRRPLRCDRRPGPAQAAPRPAAPLRGRADARAPGGRDLAGQARPGLLRRARQAGGRGARRRGTRPCRLAGVRQAAALGRRRGRRRDAAYDGRGRRGRLRVAGTAPAALPQRPAQGGALGRAPAEGRRAASTAAGSSWRSRSAPTSSPPAT